MPRTAFAVAQTTIGLAIETTRGTPEAPVYWDKVKGPKYKPDLTLIADDTLQGSMVTNYDMVRGLRYDSHGWDCYPRLDHFPVYLRCLLGSADTVTAAPASTTLAAAASAGATSISTSASIAADSYIVIGSGSTQETHYTTAVAGTAAPYTVTLASPLIYAQANGGSVTGLTKHQQSLLNNAGSGNQPPSVTITDYDGDQWRQLAAAQLDKLTLKGTAEGLVDATVNWFANPSITPSAPAPAFSTTPAVPGWTATISVNGQNLQDYVDWELDLARGVKPIPAITGTEEYFMYFAGPLTASGKITVVEQSGAPELAQYLAGTKGDLDITIYDLASGFACNLHSSNSIFKSGDLDRSKEWVEAALDFELLPSAADALAGGVSPIVTTVANSTTAAF